MVYDSDSGVVPGMKTLVQEKRGIARYINNIF